MNLIKFSKFPPEGTRGTNWKTTAGNWGNIVPSNYIKCANNNIINIIQIVTKNGIDNLDEIFTVKNIDMVIIGFSDLSRSLGFPGNIRNTAVKKSMNYIFDKANKKYTFRSFLFIN